MTGSYIDHAWIAEALFTMVQSLERSLRRLDGAIAEESSAFRRDVGVLVERFLRVTGYQRSASTNRSESFSSNGTLQTCPDG